MYKTCGVATGGTKGSQLTETELTQGEHSPEHSPLVEVDRVAFCKTSLRSSRLLTAGPDDCRLSIRGSDASVASTASAVGGVEAREVSEQSRNRRELHLPVPRRTEIVPEYRTIVLAVLKVGDGCRWIVGRRETGGMVAAVRARARAEEAAELSKSNEVQRNDVVNVCLTTVGPRGVGVEGRPKRTVRRSFRSRKLFHCPITRRLLRYTHTAPDRDSQVLPGVQSRMPRAQHRLDLASPLLLALASTIMCETHI